MSSADSRGERPHFRCMKIAVAIYGYASCSVPRLQDASLHGSIHYACPSDGIPVTGTGSQPGTRKCHNSILQQARISVCTTVDTMELRKPGSGLAVHDGYQ